MKTKLTHAIAAALLLAGISGEATAQTSGPQIKWQREVNLTVGQSMVVYGFRGDCGSYPASNSIRVPATSTGNFTLGRKGWRNSGNCNGPTPAVELIFNATSPGRETVRIQGDPVRIRVSQ